MTPNGRPTAQSIFASTSAASVWKKTSQNLPRRSSSSRWPPGPCSGSPATARATRANPTLQTPSCLQREVFQEKRVHGAHSCERLLKASGSRGAGALRRITPGRDTLRRGSTSRARSAHDTDAPDRRLKPQTVGLRNTARRLRCGSLIRLHSRDPPPRPKWNWTLKDSV
jgi:hypothetical protein